MPAFSHPVSSSASGGLGDEFRPAYGSRASCMDAVYVRQLEERAGRAVSCLLPVCGMGGAIHMQSSIAQSGGATHGPASHSFFFGDRSPASVRRTVGMQGDV